jgi:hypothetical protein
VYGASKIVKDHKQDPKGWSQQSRAELNRIDQMSVTLLEVPLFFFTKVQRARCKKEEGVEVSVSASHNLGMELGRRVGVTFVIYDFARTDQGGKLLSLPSQQ